MFNDKAGFEAMFHPQGGNLSDVTQTTVTLFNTLGTGTSDIQVSYDEAMAALKKYGRDKPNSGWSVAALCNSLGYMLSTSQVSCSPFSCN